MNPDRRHCPAPRITVDPRPGITCPRCAATSYHPDDVRYGYCGRCHAFTTELAGLWHWGVIERITDDTIRASCYLCGWWSVPMPSQQTAAEVMLAHLRSTAHQP